MVRRVGNMTIIRKLRGLYTKDLQIFAVFCKADKSHILAHWGKKLMQLASRYGCKSGWLGAWNF